MVLNNPDVLLTPIASVRESLTAYCDEKKCSRIMRSKLMSMLDENSFLWKQKYKKTYPYKGPGRKHFLIQLLVLETHDLGVNTGQKSWDTMNDFLGSTYGPEIQIGCLINHKDYLFADGTLSEPEVKERTLNLFSGERKKDYRDKFGKFASLSREKLGLLGTQKQVLAMALSLQIGQSPKLEALGDVLTPQFLLATIKENPEIADQAAEAIIQAIQKRLDSI